MNDTIIKVKNLKKHFPIRRNLTQVLRGEEKRYVYAVDGVSFEIKKGEVFGLIGESGCGKTTTGKLIMKLLEPTSGQIILNGEDVTNLKKEFLKEYKRKVQVIFQDPYACMNPRFQIRDVLYEPLIIHKIKNSMVERYQEAIRALEEVKISPPEEFMNRYPHMLSGGQRQRIATARTLILNPSLIIADEPVSMVDLSTRAELLQMMRDIQEDHDLTYLYITHDLSTARYFTDRIAVMYLGKIVELGTVDDVIDSAKHPYTQALISAVCEPVSGKVNRIKKVPIKGEITSAADIPPGCRFHPRCIYAKPECWDQNEPQLAQISENHLIACHRWQEVQDDKADTEYGIA